MELCGDCGKPLTWIEIAFGTITDPVCGKCLKYRALIDAKMKEQEKDQITGTLIGLGVIDE